MVDTAHRFGAARLVRLALGTPLTTRAWRETLYCLLGFPIAVVGFVVVVLLLAVGSGLTASLIGAAPGLLLLIAALTAARGPAAVHRWLAKWLLGERIAAPPTRRQPAGAGLLGRLDGQLRSGNGWRAVVYVLAKLPVALLGVYAVVWWAVALLNLIAPLRWLLGGASDGAGRGLSVITPLPFGGAPDITAPQDTLVAVAVGLAVLLLAPWFTRAVVAADRWLMRALLGPGALDERVRVLEASRAWAVDDTAALLRRLERDLHDGTQVRLVALAMSLDMVKQRLGVDGDPVTDPAGLRRLVDTAHQNATEALGELRSLARGLHPPVLDQGLEAALHTLTARSTVPVTLTVQVTERPTPAIETIAYFSAAELLTNVLKHSNATSAELDVTGTDRTLRLRVTDDGSGGATPDTGSGLAGLQQRIQAVDGTMRIASPAGGPTTVTITLPRQA